MWVFLAEAKKKRGVRELPDFVRAYAQNLLQRESDAKFSDADMRAVQALQRDASLRGEAAERGWRLAALVAWAGKLDFEALWQRELPWHDRYDLSVVRWQCDDCAWGSPWVLSRADDLVMLQAAALAHKDASDVPGSLGPHNVVLMRQQGRVLPHERELAAEVRRLTKRGEFVVQRVVWNATREDVDAGTVDLSGRPPVVERGVVGVPVSPGVVEGVGFFVPMSEREGRPEPEWASLDEFPAGGVLLGEYTDQNWVVVMKRSSAIVTEVGALMCHAAMVARELGVPGVTATGRGSLAALHGKRLRVDGGRGTVEVIG